MKSIVFLFLGLILHEGGCAKNEFAVNLLKSCFRTCPQSSVVMCGSDGKLHKNFCKSRCKDEKLSPRFQCSGNWQACAAKCHIRVCTADCEAQALPDAPVCGSNCVAYRNSCLLKCQPYVTIRDRCTSYNFFGCQNKCFDLCHRVL